jgi:hypothetical protein
LNFTGCVGSQWQKVVCANLKAAEDFRQACFNHLNDLEQFVEIDLSKDTKLVVEWIDTFDQIKNEAGKSS